MKSFLKQYIIPPALFNLYQNSTKQYGYTGNYQSWEDAKRSAEGKQSGHVDVIGKIYQDYKNQKRNPELWAWPIYTELLNAALYNQQKLSVLDFGGGLGSTYYEFKRLNSLCPLEWSISELPEVVTYGQKYLADKELKFYESFEDVVRKYNPQVLLLGGVLQYVDDPYRLIDDLLKHDFKCILVNRLPCFSHPDKFMVQKIPLNLGGGSIPVRIFNQTKFLEKFKHYQLKWEYDLGSPDIIKLSDYKAFCFKKD